MLRNESVDLTLSLPGTDVTREQIERAALTVKHHALDEQDYRTMLEMLGLAA